MRFLKLKEAAQRLNIDVRTFKKYILPRIPYQKINRQYLISEEYLADFLLSGMTRDIDEVLERIKKSNICVQKMKLYQRENGIYYLKHNNTKVSLKTRNREVAEKIFNFVKNLHIKNNITGTNTSTSTNTDTKKSKKLSQVIKEFLIIKENNTEPKTFICYKNSLKVFKKIIGNKDISELTFYDIELFKSKRVKQIKPVSVNSELRHIRAFLKYCYKMQYTKEYLFQDIKFFRVPEKPFNILEESEIQRIFDLILQDLEVEKQNKNQKKIIHLKSYSREVKIYTHEQIYCIFAMLLYTGRRRNEILHLTLEDIDLENRLLNFYNKKAKKYSYCPINDKLYNILSTYIQNNIKIIKFQNKLFTLHESTVTHYLKRYFRRINRPEFRTHDLRHNFASTLLKNDVDIFLVKKLLDHSNISTTLKYLHTDRKKLQEAVNKLNF